MFGEKILDYWDDIMKDLGDIVAIPSVAQPQDGPYPFGKDAATAVDKAIEIAERYGIKTKNSDYYAMHAELGEGEENAVVMAHLDVVPAGEGWDSDPYTMVIRDGKADMGAFGRALIAEPELINKYAENRLDSVRVCLGCNEGCTGHTGKLLDITCAINPRAGYEGKYPLGVKADKALKVAVVGAGPAGLQASRIVV